MYEASARPFALTDELPFRARLFALRLRDHVLLLSMHHLVSDGWSRQLLARDLSRAYAARRRGVTPDTPRLPAWTKGLHTALTEVARAEGATLFKVHSLLPAPTRTMHPPQQCLAKALGSVCGCDHQVVRVSSLSQIIEARRWRPAR